MLLYIRMLLMMAITLYTSRVILQALGVTDFGIYNVVGGIVAMFGFLNATLACGTQRFITFALGKQDKEYLNKTVSISIMFHCLLALLVIILIETIGLWFLYNKMVLPPDRIDAAFWVLQFSAISCAIGITQVPYNACIIAHEKMGAFAYISILDVTLKLAIALSLLVYSNDKLILYGLLLAIASIISMSIYRIYCLRHFEESHFRYCRDRALEKEILVFSSWNMAGTLPSTLSTQGFSLMMNTFFGPVVNAAIGVSNQVNGAVTQFVTNFQTAANPQITKLYASDNRYQMYRLIVNSAKFSCYIAMLLMIPLIVEMDIVLKIWLGDNVPQYTVVFTQIVLIQNLLQTIINPLIVCSTSVGKLKIPALVSGGALFSILPVSYILLRLGASAPLVFGVATFPHIIRLVFYSFFDKRMIGYGGFDFLREVVLKVFVIFLFALVASFITHMFIASDIINLICVCVVSTVTLAVAIFYYGLDSGSREMLLGYVRKILKR